MIPCKDCIVFAVCNASYNHYAPLEGVFITHLNRRCSNIVSWIVRATYAFSNEGDSRDQAEHEVIQYYKEFNDH